MNNPQCELEEQAINGNIQTFVINAEGEEQYDPMKFMVQRMDQIED